MTAQARVRLINFLIALRRLPPLSELSGDEERLLFELYGLAEKRDEPLFVSDVYDLGGAKSASAAYRDLVGLREKGLVKITVYKDDKRKRQIAFTPTAVDLLGKLA